MKKIFIIVTIIWGSFIFASCKKATPDNDQQKTINATIKKNEPFQYKFGLIGIEDNISISQQANNFKISELNRDSSGKIIYTYMPGLNFVGADEVEISLGISNGAVIINTVKTKIKLTVTN
ncbi:MAG: hypothetical protein ABI091_26115 [Ferruginibacter sp.]